MTMLLTILLLPTFSSPRRRLRLIAAKFGRLLNGLVATAIARYESRAARAALHRFDDRGLKDIGLSRSQIDGALATATHCLARS